jgi:hypothetical protein
MVLTVCPSGCVCCVCAKWISYVGVGHVPEWINKLMLAVPEYMSMLVLAVCPSGCV